MILLIQESSKAAGPVSEGATGLTLWGWIFISIVWTTVISLLIFCYRKILQKSAEQKKSPRPESLPH